MRRRLSRTQGCVVGNFFRTKRGSLLGASLLAFWLLFSSGTASADISDAVFFLSEVKDGPVRPGAYTVVHYFRESCDCCLEKAEAMKGKETSRLRYSSVFAKDGPLPRYEVYDKRGKLLHSSDQALQWVRENF